MNKKIASRRLAECTRGTDLSVCARVWKQPNFVELIYSNTNIHFYVFIKRDLRNSRPYTLWCNVIVNFIWYFLCGSGRITLVAGYLYDKVVFFTRNDPVSNITSTSWKVNTFKSSHVIFPLCDLYIPSPVVLHNFTILTVPNSPCLGLQK